MPPLSILIKPVSGLCSMRCTYCFYADEMAHRDVPTHAPMSDATLERLVRRALAYADGTVAFAFQGGEPTLAGADFFRRFLALERQYNTRHLPISHALQTNGLSLTPSLLDVLREGQFLVGVSVDGTRSIHDSRRLDSTGHGTYDRVMATLTQLRREHIDYNILCVVDRQIAAHPQEVFDALKPHGYLQFIPCMEALDGAPTADSLTPEAYGAFLCALFDEYERAFRAGRYVSIRLFDNWLNLLAGQPPEACSLCGRCSPNYLVESDGSVYPCDFYALDEWLLGNINDASFFRLAASPTLRRFCEVSLELDPACRVCRWLPLCRGGCRREREPFVDGRPRRFRLCEGHRFFWDTCYGRMLALAQLPPPRLPGNG